MRVKYRDDFDVEGVGVKCLAWERMLSAMPSQHQISGPVSRRGSSVGDAVGRFPRR